MADADLLEMFKSRPKSLGETRILLYFYCILIYIDRSFVLHYVYYAIGITSKRSKARLNYYYRKNYINSFYVEKGRKKEIGRQIGFEIKSAVVRVLLGIFERFVADIDIIPRVFNRYTPLETRDIFYAPSDSSAVSTASFSYDRLEIRFSNLRVLSKL